MKKKTIHKIKISLFVEGHFTWVYVANVWRLGNFPEHTVGYCYLNCNNSQSSSPISYLVYFYFDITNKMTSSLVIVKVTARTLIIWSLPGNNIFAHKDIFYLLQIEFLSSQVIIPCPVWIANKDHLFWLSWLRNAIWFEIQI